MRLTKGGAYRADLGGLRDQIRANGTNPQLATVTVTHPQVPHAVDLLLNLAYQPNSAFPPINGSLYVVGFTNPQGTWHFNVGLIGVALPGAAIPGALAGDYGSLGWPLALPPITDGNLAQAVSHVAGYAGAAPVPATVKDGLTRLIIAVSEAARFAVVESGISQVLGKVGAAPYTPPHAVVHNWGGHTLGD